MRKSYFSALISRVGIIHTNVSATAIWEVTRISTIVEAQDMHELRLIQLKEEESNRRLMATALKEAKDMVEMRRNFLAILTREVMAPVQYVSAELYKQENLQERIGKIRAGSLSMYSKLLRVCQNTK